MTEDDIIEKHYNPTTKTLNVSGLGLKSLPPLPEGLERLYCHNNQLTSLPPLPEGLERLDCYNNQLTALPPLPDGLEELYCDDNIRPKNRQNLPN